LQCRGLFKYFFSPSTEENERGGVGFHIFSLSLWERARVRAVSLQCKTLTSILSLMERKKNREN
jgi:hypothetical protein